MGKKLDKLDKFSIVDKEYLEGILEDRIGVLRDKYNQLQRSEDENGNTIKNSVAAVYKSLVRKDMRACILILELMQMIPEDEIALTKEASRGFDRLTEPIERYSSLKVEL
jgi:hypothetical protein